MKYIRRILILLAGVGMPAGAILAVCGRALLGATLMLVSGGGLFAAVCLCAARKRRPGTADCLVVLGAKVWPDGRMSTTLRNRCGKALEAWQQGMAKQIIVCGGRVGDEPCTEAKAMHDWLAAQGVSEEHIFSEDQSADTRQNLRNARAIMQRNGWRTAVVVTSDFHVQRALWIVRDIDIAAQGLSAPCSGRRKTWLKNRLREMRSWLLYALRG